MSREDSRSVGVCLGISGAVIALTRSQRLIALAEVTWPLGLWQQQPGQQAQPVAVARKMLKRARRRLGLPRSCAVSVVIGPSLSDRRPEEVLSRSVELLASSGLPQTWVTSVDQAEALRERLAPVVGELGAFAAGEEAGLAIGAAISALAVPRTTAAAPPVAREPQTAVMPIDTQSAVALASPAPAMPTTGVEPPLTPGPPVPAPAVTAPTFAQGTPAPATPVPTAPLAPQAAAPTAPLAPQAAAPTGSPDAQAAAPTGSPDAQAAAPIESSEAQAVVLPASQLPPDSDAVGLFMPPAPPASHAPQDEPRLPPAPLPSAPVVPGIWPVTVTVPAPVLLPPEPPAPPPPPPPPTEADSAEHAGEPQAVFPLPPRKER